MTGSCGHRRFVLAAAVTAVCSALVLSGCAPDLVQVAPARAADTSPMSVPSGPQCSGAAAEQLLVAFFRDLETGQSNLVPRYFAPADAFIRWSDPKSGQIGGQPGDATAALDQLREHLFGLEVDGLVESLASFTDLGYLDRGTANAGGWFEFALHGSPASGVAPRSGQGDGAIDCVSGRIKILTIDQW